MLATLWAIEKEAVSIILLILVIINILIRELYLKRHGRSHLDWVPVEHRIFWALSNCESTLTLP
jgi:hypothetical protein